MWIRTPEYAQIASSLLNPELWLEDIFSQIDSRNIIRGLHFNRVLF